MTNDRTASRARSKTHPAAADIYLSPEQVCVLVPGLSVRTLRELRAAGRGPRYAKPTPKTVVYLEGDIHTWVRSTLQPTREQPIARASGEARWIA